MSQSLCRSIPEADRKCGVQYDNVDLGSEPPVGSRDREGEPLGRGQRPLTFYLMFLVQIKDKI